MANGFLGLLASIPILLLPALSVSAQAPNVDAVTSANTATELQRHMAEQAAVARRIMKDAPVAPPREQAKWLGVVRIREVFVIDGMQVIVEQQIAESLRDVNGPIAVGQPQAPHWQVASEMFDRTVFRASRSMDQVRRELDQALRTKIAAVDRVGRLTAVQKQKLELAGGGDIRRLFERLDELRALFESRRDDPVKAVPVLKEAANLRIAFQTGPFGESSLFAKILKSMITPEQAAEAERTPHGPGPTP